MASAEPRVSSSERPGSALHGLRCAPAGWAGGGQGVIPSCSGTQRGWVRSEITGGKGEEEALEGQFWASPGMEIPRGIQVP